MLQDVSVLLTRVKNLKALRIGELAYYALACSGKDMAANFAEQAHPWLHALLSDGRDPMEILQVPTECCEDYAKWLSYKKCRREFLAELVQSISLVKTD